MKQYITLLVSSALLGMLVFMHWGCSSKLAFERGEAIAIAKQQVIRRGWKDVQVESATLEKDVWEIMLWRLPKTPGGHALVEVSSDGTVLRIILGK